MVQSAEAETADTSAQPRPQAGLSTPHTSSHEQDKTQTHRSTYSIPSITRQEPQNVADKATWTSPRQDSTIETLAGANSRVSALKFASLIDREALSMDSSLRAQEEANRLHVALALQHVQQEDARTKQLGIAMTSSSTIGSGSSSSTTTSTTITTATRTSGCSSTRDIAGLTRKTLNDGQMLQQTQSAPTLQQNTQHPAIVTGLKCSTDEWIPRKKLVLEQEHVQQQSQGGNGTFAAKRGLATSIADTLLAQQQQVIRQQQMLRDMLQRQQQQQQTQLQLQLQMKWKQEGNKSASKDVQPILKTSAVTAVATNTFVTTSPTCYSMKKKVLKDAFDMDLEALARVCIRVANARTESEMRQALEKVTSWLHRCTELPLLQLAQRDYCDSISRRRSMLIQQDRWPLDLQVKSEYITHKMVQMLGVLLLRERNKDAQRQHAAVIAAAAMKSTVATPASSDTTLAGGIVSSGPAASFADDTATAPDVFPTTAIQTTSASSSVTSGSNSLATATPSVIAAGPTTAAVALKQAVVPATATTTRIQMALSPRSTTPDQSARFFVMRDMAAIERAYADLKDQLQAKQVEVNQKAKAKRDAAKVEATKATGTISNHETTAAMLAAMYKRPMQSEVLDVAKKQRTDAYAVPLSSITAAYRPSTASVPPISPRLAQQFYDLGLTTRTSSESEDKMYIPSKIVSKIMYKVLPGVQEENAAAGDAVIKHQEQAISKVVSPAIFPSHGTLDYDSCLQDTVSISDDAVTFMQECVTEFILYFTSESRDLSVMQNRRTKKGVGLSISGANIVESMENLGFMPYARVLAGYNEKVKASQDAAARKKMGRKNSIQQRVLQTKSAATAATVAVNATKMAAAARRSEVLPYMSTQGQIKSGTQFSPFSQDNTATLPSADSSSSAVSRSTTVPAAKTGIVTAKPAVPATLPTVSLKPAIGGCQQPLFQEH